MALVDDIADLLAVHNEVNAVCGQCQERVMDMMQLKKGQAIIPLRCYSCFFLINNGIVSLGKHSIYRDGRMCIAGNSG